MVDRRKRGKPVIHPRVLNTKTGEIFETFTEAGESCGGNRWGVMRSCEGLQNLHMGIKFKYVRRKRDGTDD